MAHNNANRKRSLPSLCRLFHFLLWLVLCLLRLINCHWENIVQGGLSPRQRGRLFLISVRAHDLFSLSRKSIPAPIPLPGAMSTLSGASPPFSTCPATRRGENSSMQSSDWHYTSESEDMSGTIPDNPKHNFGTRAGCMHAAVASFGFKICNCCFYFN